MADFLRENMAVSPDLRLDRRSMLDRASSLRSLAIALLVVAAPALGGSVELWSRGLLVLATGALLIVLPPRRAPGRWWLGLFLALAAIPLAAFLPQAWFPLSTWRQTLTATFGLALPASRTAQPWLTLEGAGIDLAGLIFALALVAHRWDREERHRALRLYALGILILTGFAVGSVALHHPIPFWPRPLNSGLEFGFFPNRNQTANVLALGGIVCAALGVEDFRRRKKGAFGWLAGVVLIGAALVVAYSRAGIALFFGGAAAWAFVSSGFSRSKKGIPLSIAGVLVLLTLFFLFGGSTLERFEHQGAPFAHDYRLEIQRDALHLTTLAPWLGQGLGNFEPLFCLMRVASAQQNRVIHPESDWLWAAVELGWPAVVLLVAALVLWLKESLPLDPGSDRRLRSAAIVCGVVFALHGLVDVSGHRLGSLWPALFLCSVARHPDRTNDERAWVAPLFRALGVVLMLFGGWWMATGPGHWRTESLPTSGTLALLSQDIDQATASVDFPSAESAATAALRIAPLDWPLYFQRGVARTGAPERWQAAVGDFDVARFLEPRWVDLCFNEGKIWLALDEPDLTLDAWGEALRRAGPAAPALFERMVGAASTKVRVRTALEILARSKIDFLMTYLQGAEPLECDLEISRLLERDPALATLSQAQRRLLFAAWFRHGDAAQLVSLLAERPEWIEDAWFGLARYYGAKGDYERAYLFTKNYGPTPPLPHLAPARSLAELEREFHFHPDDFQTGLELYESLHTLRQIDEALTTLLAVEHIAGRPDYILYLEAELWAEKGDWPKAWDAWNRYADSQHMY